MKSIYFALVLLMPLLLCGRCFCQESTAVTQPLGSQRLDVSDLERIESHERSAGVLADRQVRYGFGKGGRSLNPFYHLLSSGMYLYQRCISPVIARSCAYSPSCSAYSKALIKEYGLLRGTVCTADRLMRCNRISLADRGTYGLIDRKDGHIHENVDRYRLGD